MGARAWLACVQADLAATLLRRGASGDAERAAALRDPAMQTAESLGMPLLREQLRSLATLAPAPAACVPASALSCRLVHEGDFWTVRFDGTTSRVRDAKGMRYLRVLLARPGQDFHVLALVADVEGAREASPSPVRMSDAGPGASGDAPQRRRRLRPRARRPGPGVLPQAPGRPRGGARGGRCGERPGPARPRGRRARVPRARAGERGRPRRPSAPGRIPCRARARERDARAPGGDRPHGEGESRTRAPPRQRPCEPGPSAATLPTRACRRPGSCSAGRGRSGIIETP